MMPPPSVDDVCELLTGPAGTGRDAEHVERIYSYFDAHTDFFRPLNTGRDKSVMLWCCREVSDCRP